MIERAREVGAIPLHEQREPAAASPAIHRILEVFSTNNPDELRAKIDFAGLDAHPKIRKQLAATTAEIAARSMQMLNQRNVCTIYRGQVSGSPDQIYIERATPLPFSCTIQGGQKEPTLTFYFHTDDEAIPLLVTEESVTIFDATRSLSSSWVRFADRPKRREKLRELQQLALKAYTVLETAWKRQSITLQELSLSFGIVGTNRTNKELAITSLIDNENWRLSLNRSDLTQDLRLDSLSPQPTEKELKLLFRKYRTIANMTRRFSAQ